MAGQGSGQVLAAARVRRRRVVRNRVVAAACLIGHLEGGVMGQGGGQVLAAAG